MTVLLADGYAGHPPDAPYDRIIVTVGVTGLSSPWLDQLAPGGMALAPVFHAGAHPILRVQRDPDGTVRGRGICAAGFMAAAGPLGARYPDAHPEPVRGGPLPPPTVRVPGRWYPALDQRRYHDVGVAAGAWNRRVTFGRMQGVEGADIVLLDETRTGGAAITSAGSVLATGPAARSYADQAGVVLDRWERAGTPAVEDWHIEFALAGDADRPVWAPRHWHL